MTMGKKVEAGQIVAIGLDGGGYALAWLSHVGSERRPAIIGRFHAVRFDEVPSVEDAHTFVATNTPEIIGVVGDLGIKDGSWIPIGEPIVPEGGFQLPALLEYTNIGTPAVEVLDEETYNSRYSRPATEEDLSGDIGTGGAMGHVFISQRLELIIEGAPANSGRPGELFKPDF